ncbi:MAG: ACP S-malonyltransferase, partial [Planctomycetota bacterium]
MKTVYIFPGQGAQYVGMGKDIAEQYPQASSLFERANDIL